MDRVAGGKPQRGTSRPDLALCATTWLFVARNDPGGQDVVATSGGLFLGFAFSMSRYLSHAASSKTRKLEH